MMKRLSTLFIVATTAFFLIGCGNYSKAELETVKSDLVEANKTITQLEGKIEELSTKLEKVDKTLPSITLGDYSAEKTSLKITIGQLQSLDDYQKVMDNYRKTFESQGKKVIYPDKPFGNRIYIVRTNSKVTNLTHANYGTEFNSEFGCDQKEYFKKYGINTSGNLAKELNPDEILIFAANETEGAPSDYFSWTETNGNVYYRGITYDGTGEIDEYEQY